MPPGTNRFLAASLALMLIAAALLGVAGASAYFRGGVVVYTGDGKQRLTGMTPEQIAQLEERLYGWDEDVGANAIEVCVHRLRKKIEIGGVRIATVRGLGYCLEKFAPVAADSGAAGNA